LVRGRKRRHNPEIPAHIDQTRLPANIYFDHRNNGVWYTLSTDEGGNRRRKNVASGKALLSDLHRIMEEKRAVGRGTLQWLSAEFLNSPQFKALSKSTRDDYTVHAAVLNEFPTKLGKPLGALDVDKFTEPLVQRIVDKIAGQGTPAKAVHCLRYLRRLLNWGRNRGFNQFILPSRVIELPEQRKRRRLPHPAVMANLIRFAAERGQRVRGEKGAVAAYLWSLMDVAYLCRLRGIEAVTLTDAQIGEDGVRTNRRKGSRDNVVRWTPRLRAAIDAALARREAIWTKKKMPVPLAADKRFLFVAAHGGVLQKSSLDSAFQRLIAQALEAEVITEENRFGLHDLKRRGITDTIGTRADKQEASGHKSEQMMDVYDFSLPIVDPAAL
jgi:integrase